MTHLPGRLPWWGALGVAVVGLGAVLLALEVEAWNTAWFLFAWYGVLLIVDAAIFRAEGSSFIAGRRRELLAMMFWSVPFWTAFEAYNLVLETWYYTFLPHDERAQAAFAFAAFATVLPACFFPAELLGAFGVWEKLRIRPLRVSRGLLAAIGVLGVAGSTLPLVWPRQLFWLVWAGLGVPAVINWHTSAESLLRDLSRGEPARPLRLLCGGLLAGAAWEGFNFPARARWVYTVPGFTDLKLFEMPLLGFVGFPVLALYSFEFYSLVSYHLRGGRSFQVADGAQKPRRVPYAPYVTMGLIVLFSVGATFITLDPAVLARRPLLGDIEGIGNEGERGRERESRLREIGIPTPERLCAALAKRGVARVAEESGIPEPELTRAAHHAGLALHKGIGTTWARVLMEAGVHEVKDLAARDAGDLHAELIRRAPPGSRIPTAPEVHAWIRGARTSWLPGVPPSPGRDCR